MIPFIDLQAQRACMAPELGNALRRVLERGDFIQGEEVSEFERQLADFTGASHVISCGNGTDALTLVGMAESINPGDVVFVPSFTYVATAEAFVLLGAVPYFIDVDPETFIIDVSSLRRGIHDARVRGLKPRMIVAVDLFGQPADYRNLSEVAREEGLTLVADAAQSLGARLNGQSVGTLADYTTTSFFPSKPLGCYGDGGAIMTNDAEKAMVLKSLTIHGKGAHKYDNVRIGMNSRLDTLQAAVLIEKLKIFRDELSVRERLATEYNRSLSEVVQTPKIVEGGQSAWALYTVLVKNRDQLQAHLRDVGIPTVVYYQTPLHKQAGYSHFPTVPGGPQVSETLSSKVLSLPFHPYLCTEMQEQIISQIRVVEKLTL